MIPPLVFCSQAHSKLSSSSQQQNFQGSRRFSKICPPTCLGFFMHCKAGLSTGFPDPLTLTLWKSLTLSGPAVGAYDRGMFSFRITWEGQLQVMHTHAHKATGLTGFGFMLYCTNVGRILCARNVRLPTNIASAWSVDREDSVYEAKY